MQGTPTPEKQTAELTFSKNYSRHQLHVQDILNHILQSWTKVKYVFLVNPCGS
jgi:hypothetical protein